MISVVKVDLFCGNIGGDAGIGEKGGVKLYVIISESFWDRHGSAREHI